MKSKKEQKRRAWSVAEKLETLQARQRGLTLGEIKSLFGISADTLYKWQEIYQTTGIAGLEQIRAKYSARVTNPVVTSAQSVLSEITEADPYAGIGKVQGALYRRGFLELARETVRRLLRRNGKAPLFRIKGRRNKPPKIHYFERANPNELWQTDIMSFMLKGQYRVYLIGFMDDHSRFLVGWGLHRFQTTVHVLEVFREAIEKHGMPKEVLSDNGRQYYTWRGKSKFTELLTKLGIRHIRSRPYHPQTLGKIESFWRNLFQECLSSVPLASFEQAKEKIGEYIEYYNFKRPHQGIGNLYPADRFYRVDGQVKQIIENNTEKIEGEKPPLANYTPCAYLVGNLGGKELRVVAKSAEVSLEERAPKIVESITDREKSSFGGCCAVPAGKIVEEKANLSPSSNEPEAKNGTGGDTTSSAASRALSCFSKTEDAASSQASQPTGTDGFNPAGIVSGRSDRTIVPASGSIKGTVLPVDEGGSGGGTQSPGSQSAGSQNDSVPESGREISTTPKDDAAIGAPEPETSEGAQSPGFGSKSLSEDHSSAGLGSTAGSGI